MKNITKDYLKTHQLYPMDLGIMLNHVEDPKISFNVIKEFYEETLTKEEAKDNLEEVLEYYSK